MFVHEMATPNPDVLLVKPDVDRDASLSVRWLEGEEGRKTLRLMGVNEAENQPSSLEKEQQRVRDFLDNPDARNWMIAYKGEVVGAIWIDLSPTPTMPAPSVHIMLGDPQARGKGVGSAAFRAALDWLRTNEALYPLVYSRHLTANEAADGLLVQNNFVALGDPYKDEDGLEWQNFYLRQQRIIQYVAVKAIIIQDGKVLVLRQIDDPAVENGNKCHPPGGVVEPGEALTDALRREVKEETNLDIDVRELISADEWQVQIRGDHCQFCGFFFAGEVSPTSESLQVDAEESTEALWVSLETLDEAEIVEPSRSLIKRALEQRQHT